MKDESLEVIRKKSYRINDCLNKARKAKIPNLKTISRLENDLKIYRGKLHELLAVKDLDGEQWKVIPNYSKYECSNFGRIRSSRKRLMSQTVAGKYRKYLVTHMYHDDGRYLSPTVHRTIAITWVENANKLPEVNHIDCNDRNNHASNLEWVTRQQNMDHAVKNRLVLSGENQKSAKLTNDQVRELRKLKKENPKITYHELGRMYGVDHSNAYRIAIGVNYRYVE